MICISSHFDKIQETYEFMQALKSCLSQKILIHINYHYENKHHGTTSICQQLQDDVI